MEERQQLRLHTVPSSDLLSPEPTCMTTEYREKFLPHDVRPVHIPKKLRDEHEAPKGKMANMTTFRADYVAHSVVHRPLRVNRRHIPPEGSMTFSSTYAEDYQPHPVQQRKVARSAEYSPPSAEMQLQSLYRGTSNPNVRFSFAPQEEFQKWAIKRQEPLRPEPDNLKVHKGKFEATTTSREDYSPKSVMFVRENFKPAPLVKESLPFDGMTNYRAQYVCHPGYSGGSTPVTQRAAYKPNSEPFAGVSTHRLDYRGLQGETAKPFRPTTAFEKNSSPFEGHTESSEKYRAWTTVMTRPNKAVNICPLNPRPQAPRTHPAAKDTATRQIWSTVKEDCRTRGARRNVWLAKKEEITTRATGSRPTSRPAVPQLRSAAVDGVHPADHDSKDDIRTNDRRLYHTIAAGGTRATTHKPSHSRWGKSHAAKGAPCIQGRRAH
ncbi:stabilizer of axonemal microtubules 1 isoform X1 [Arapaima gigas]